jgi:hypothetical protein
VSATDYTRSYYQEVEGYCYRQSVERIIDILVEVRQSGGRLFILGVGGGPVTPGTPSTISESWNGTTLRLANRCRTSHLPENGRICDELRSFLTRACSSISTAPGKTFPLGSPTTTPRRPHSSGGCTTPLAYADHITATGRRAAVHNALALSQRVVRDRLLCVA